MVVVVDEVRRVEDEGYVDRMWRPQFAVKHRRFPVERVHEDRRLALRRLSFGQDHRAHPEIRRRRDGNQQFGRVHLRVGLAIRGKHLIGIGAGYFSELAPSVRRRSA